MTTRDRLNQIYAKSAWALTHRDGIRKLRAVRVVTKEDKELKWCHLGFMYDHLADPTKPALRRRMEAHARYAYRQALRLNPNCTTAMIGMGRILLHRKDKRALAWYRTAHRTDPYDARAEFSLAVACSLLGELNEADRLLTRLHKRDPDCFGYAYNLATLKSRRGNRKLARYYASVALRLFSTLPRVEQRSKGAKEFKSVLENLAKK